jgi:hypothetical protein
VWSVGKVWVCVCGGGGVCACVHCMWVGGWVGVFCVSLKLGGWVGCVGDVCVRGGGVYIAIVRWNLFYISI